MVAVYEELRDFSAMQDRRTRQISLPGSSELDRRGLVSPHDQQFFAELHRLSVVRSPHPVNWGLSPAGSLGGMPTGGSASPYVLSTASINSPVNAFVGRPNLISSPTRSSTDPRLLSRPGVPSGFVGSGLARPIPRYQGAFGLPNFQAPGLTPGASPVSWLHSPNANATASTTLSTQSGVAAELQKPLIPTVVPEILSMPVPEVKPSPEVSPVIPDFSALNIGGAAATPAAPKEEAACPVFSVVHKLNLTMN
ncbi:unnamed protein product [Notodromas monacha]|nr:unnamed protein product [Notodromas monacha]CAG0924752.1 unnamed protein product [Notodromas monacha]